MIVAGWYASRMAESVVVPSFETTLDIDHVHLIDHGGGEQPTWDELGQLTDGIAPREYHVRRLKDHFEE